MKEKDFSARQSLKAPPSIIRANFLRLFDSIKAAAKKTSISRSQIHLMIKRGEISEIAVGRLYKLGIDPSELIKRAGK